MAFEKVISKLRGIDPNAIIRNALEGEKAFIEQLQVNQLYSGKTAEGADIVPSYKPSTIARKIRKGHPVDRVTLKDTGKFHKSTKAEFLSDSVELDNEDPKARFLTAKYGPGILGLTPDNISLLREKMTEPLILRFQNLLLQ